MKLLDCFCGMGGASEGFHREGFECTGIDIVNVGYPYKLILKDIRELDGKDFQGYDVIWGSPPCRDFSRIATTDKKFWRGKWVEWKNPANPHRGLILVHAFLAFVKEAKPYMWIMENVPGLKKHLVSKATQTSYISVTMKRSFWGNFPSFLMPMQMNVPKKSEIRNPHLRAKIPLACSLAFARACKNQILEVAT